MAQLPDPHTMDPAGAQRTARILFALADDLEAHTHRPANRVGIDYRNLIANRGRRAVIAAIRFRALAYQRRWDRWVADLYKHERD